MKHFTVGKRLTKLETEDRLEIPLRPVIVWYKYPATASAEEKEAAKAAAWEQFRKEHPELIGRRVPVITFGVGKEDINLPWEGPYGIKDIC
jgi:hypothetical protein